MGDGERDELLGTVNISRMTGQQFGTFVCTRRSGSMELSSSLHAGQQLRTVLVLVNSSRHSRQLWVRGEAKVKPLYLQTCCEGS